MVKKIIKINKYQHEDFIWTWKSNDRNAKVSIWIPYFSEVTKEIGTGKWKIIYNGGELVAELNKIDFILFYGATGNLPLAFLDDLSMHGITFIIHRQNMVRPYFFFPSNVGSEKDVLSSQILCRENEIKRTYIARLLISERINSFKRKIPVYDEIYRDLGKARTVDRVRGIEANASARYWKFWFQDLGFDESRRSDNPISTALDAGSKFFYGIILRWILFHKLSPCHGYLHVTTNYPSLVYDLMEPYRYIIEDAVSAAYIETNSKDEKILVAKTLQNIKESLDEVVYVPATRQYIRRKNLLHGIVLALRVYLLSESKRLIIPVEGERKGGRTPNCKYKLPADSKGN